MSHREARAGTRERLIEAAGEVFAEKGFRAATVREITKRAEVNIAAINYYFRDKEELYAAVLLHAHRCALESDEALKNEGAPEERLRGFIGGMLRHLLNPLRPAWHSRLMAREMTSPTRMLQHLIDEGVRPKARRLEAILRELTGEDFPDEQLHLIGTSIIGQCVFFRQNRPVIQSLYPDVLGREDSIEYLADHITSFSLAGIERLKEARPSGLSYVLL